MEREYETYEDDDPNVIGEAIQGDKTIVFISAPGDSIDWEKIVVIPTFDKNRVLVATPVEWTKPFVEQDVEVVKEILDDLLNEGILAAEKHWESVGE